MELSRTHWSFIDRGYSLETLGPNCKTVLNFWLYLDSLTEPPNGELWLPAIH
jgi:hypothetical protein